MEEVKNRDSESTKNETKDLREYILKEINDIKKGVERFIRIKRRMEKKKKLGNENQNFRREGGRKR